MDIFVKIALALIIGIIGGKLAKLIKLPSVSGYLIAGLFVGPTLFKNNHIMSSTDLESLKFIGEVALSFIAFSIGSEFVVSEIKKQGKKVLIITLAEVFGAVLLVFSLMYFVFNRGFAFSIIIASMSAATAPAATLLVMRQYRAYGPVTKTLLSVVAFDDVLGIIVFGISLSLAKISLDPGSVSVAKIIFNPLIEIFGSIALGFGIGFILTIIAKRQKDPNDLQAVSIAAIILGLGLSRLLNLSPLLTNIAIGMTLVNIMKKSYRVFDSVNGFVTPFYILFFTLAGAELNLSILSQGVIILTGVVYIFARGFGKFGGAFIGGKIAKAEPTVTKYLGFGLLPQGGISISLLQLLRGQIPQSTLDAITTIIMFSILIYETTGPVFSKLAITLAGEIDGIDNLDTNGLELSQQTN